MKEDEEGHAQQKAHAPYLFCRAFSRSCRRDSSFTACLNRSREERLDKGGVEVSEKTRWVDWEADRVAAHFEVDPAVGLDTREAESG